MNENKNVYRNKGARSRIKKYSIDWLLNESDWQCWKMLSLGVNEMRENWWKIQSKWKLWGKIATSENQKITLYVLD